MSKSLILATAILAGVAATPAAAAPIGPDAAACRSGEPAALLRVEGFKQRTGTLRVQVYDSADAFLEKGRKLKRIELPVSASGPMDVCVAVPAAGRYAFAVRHDVDGGGKSGWNDGGGFTRNPKVSLFKLKPAYEDVVVQVGRAARPLEVVLNYRQGLSIGPVTAGRM